MKNARILLVVLMLAGLVKVAFSQEAAKKDAVPVAVVEEEVIAVVDNGTNVVVDEIDVIEEVIVNAAE